MFAIYLLLLALALPTFAQRPFYAGSRPIGYPSVVPVRTPRRVALPPQLNGDTYYANRLDQLPQNQQPFWYINNAQYDDLRKNPKTYPLRPNVFASKDGK